MKGLTFNNKTLYLSAVPTHYKSFMLVVNGNAIPGVDYNIMEIGDLAINDISGFNYVTANPTANFQGINPPSYCVDGDTGTKWMTSQYWTSNTQSGMVIFTVNDPIVPSSYKLFNAGDAADRDGSKLPGPRALYGSTGTPTISSDPSWELLSYTDYKLPVENLVWTSAMPTSNNQHSIEGVLGFNDSLPAYTLRLKFTDGVTPTFSYGGTAVQVSSSPNIWDLTYENSDWSQLLRDQSELLEIIDCGDTSGVTNFFILCQGCSKLTSICLLDTSNATSLRGMFWECASLTALPLFDTSNVTDIHDLCYGCTSLIYVPLFNTSKVTNVNYMFYNCTNVSGGALALYNQMSTQQNPPSNHLNCFRNCGSNTQTGAAELAHIPSSWK